MSHYINGISCVSAFGGPEGTMGEGIDRYKCLEPDYNQIIDPNRLRRMSRIMRISLATALRTLEAANVQTPDAVVTATGLGCLYDTGDFIVKMCDPTNRMMNPTAFIQSIHNTMGGQIAINLKRNCYNNTFTQDVISFEHALLDTIMLLKEGLVENVLLGGIDENTGLKHGLTSRLFKAQKEWSGYFGQGEGCAFFSLSSVPSQIKLNTLILSYDAMHADIIDYFANHLSLGESTLIFTGKSGGKNDEAYTFMEKMIGKSSAIDYKRLCGDYPTASSFAMWLACEVLQKRAIPGIVLEPPRHVIVYHAYSDRPHTLIHLSRC